VNGTCNRGHYSQCRTHTSRMVGRCRRWCSESQNATDGLVLAMAAVTVGALLIERSRSDRDSSSRVFACEIHTRKIKREQTNSNKKVGKRVTPNKALRVAERTTEHLHSTGATRTHWPMYHSCSAIRSSQKMWIETIDKDRCQLDPMATR